jgi:hypothetical protein
VRLSDMLGLQVREAAGHRVGAVVDVRLVLDGVLDDHPGMPTLFGLVISPRTRSSYLGFERSDARHPVLLAALARWRHRGTFLVGWQDIARIGDSGVALRDGYTKYSALLREAD